MDEHAEDPVGQAGQKVVQYASLATMAGEAIAQVRQQRAAAAAAHDAQTAAALRAQRTAALTAARTQWQPVLDNRLRSRTTVADAGLAWAAAQGWREFDPQAALASDRALERLRELRPDVTERFDRLTGQGLDPVEAMRRVAPFFDRPAARPGEHAAHAALPPMPAAAGGRDSHDAAGDAESLMSAGVDTCSSVSRQHYIDTGQYLPTADADSAVQAGAVDTATASTYSRSAADLAKDGFPESLTAEVLAAGRLRPKAPASTAPAAVRSTGLATAARAASRTR